MKYIFSISIVLLALFSENGFAQNVPAFPGAEGFGKYTTGGRGGRVIYVTILEDNNLPGSLRYAINQLGARIVLFKVSGTIQLTSMLKITNGDITIAGQTAPGDGITLRDYPVYVGADNVILRFLRFRMGDETEQQNDAIWGREQKNIIIDHCSMSWSTDECASFYDNENFTLQWSIVAESLRNSIHEKGEHGYGGIWGGQKASFHHNLLAHNDSRNPRFCGSRYSNEAESELVDFRNNVIYNWSGNSTYAGEGGSYNMVNNYYKAGPATPSKKNARILEAYADNGGNEQAAGIFGTFFMNGNVTTESSVVSDDNWEGVILNSTFSTYASGITIEDIKSTTEFETGEVTTHSADVAFEKIVAYCGASLVRDSVDLRIINDVNTGKATITDGGNGSTNGLIDRQSAVGGWPVLKSEDAPVDTDEDGMPDAWESANGLSPADNSDAQLKTVDSKYPNIEVYLNSLVGEIVSNQNSDGVATSAEKIADVQNETKIYFNKTQEALVVENTDEIVKMQIFSVTGQLLFVQNYSQHTIRMNTGFLTNGIYQVAVTDAQNKVHIEKIIKY